MFQANCTRRRLSFAIFAAAVFSILLALNSPAHGQSNEVCWKLKANDRFIIELNQTSKSNTTVDSRETSVESKTEIEMSWEVSKVDSKGNATIRQTITGINLLVNGFTRKKKGETGSPLLEVVVNTSNPAKTSKQGKQLLKQIQPLLNIPIDVVMSPTGEIDVKDSTEVAKLLNKLPNTQNLRQLFSPAGLKEMMGASSVILPQPLSIGQTWNQQSKTDTAMGAMEQTETYTYLRNRDGEQGQVAEFSVATELKPLDSTSDQQGSSLQGELLSFGGSGTLLLDIENGYFSNSKLQNTISTEKPYREKMIKTTVSNEIEMNMRRQK
ncbi:hypothetical protein N9B31_03320 [Mariniblastus sp.]|nr:hypothetical protein [Mariniblastus sp.]MDB4374528.1 hypothetical protein [bacterium]MDA7902666.1 hypothetical protein [Mariniblastus sp.]MDB4380772.1 hypothetical protein [Mariniblastus sp.]MDB4460303.1 hypothetical protein [bacterium]